MAYRVRIQMSWTVITHPGFAEGVPFSSVEDFKALAHEYLVKTFASYNAALTIETRAEMGYMFELGLTWDVDLDGVAGAWHDPSDHTSYAQNKLVDGIKSFAYRLKVESINRHLPLNKAMDHGEMLVEAREQGYDIQAGDYPVYRTEPHPDWPEATEIYLQDGIWFWNDPTSDRTPFVGPQPERLFTPWTGSERQQALDALRGRA